MCAPLSSLIPTPQSLVPIGVALPGAWHPRSRLCDGAAFHVLHLWVPVIVFLALTTLLMGLHWDFWLADRLYALEGHAWTLQSAYVTQDLLHASGRQASKNAWFVLLLVLLISLFAPPVRQWRRPLAYLLLATLLSTVAVGALKRYTNMDCPWDLLRYGGSHSYYGLLTDRPPSLGRAQCFPGGHASAGYAWIALYFFFSATRRRWRWWGLGFGLATGFLFGIAQQLRGAHFLSHDLWALMICWLVALALQRLMLCGRPAPGSSGAAA